MNNNRFKIGNLLLFAIVLCGILTACSNPTVTDTRSNNNTLSKLMVNKVKATEVKALEMYTASVESDVSSVEISFSKPLGATAILTSGGEPKGSFPVKQLTSCATTVEVKMGPNPFIIAIMSENESVALYTLTITRLSVNDILVTSISLSGYPTTMNAGEPGIQLTAAVAPTNATIKDVTWKSSDSTIIEVSSSGFITAKPKTHGAVTITATAVGGIDITKEIIITVKSNDNAISGLTVNGVGNLGKSPSFAASVLYEDSPVEICFSKPEWSTAAFANLSGDDDDPVEFDESKTDCSIPDVSLEVGPNLFSIIITSESGEPLTHFLAITRAKSGVIPVQKIELSGVPATMNVGASVQLIATLTPTEPSDPGVIWTSSDPSVIEVSVNGLITAKAHGSATITAAPHDDGGASPAVTDPISVKSISFNITELTVDGKSIGGASPYLTSVEYPVGSVPMTFKKPLWASAELKDSSGNTIGISIAATDTETETCSADLLLPIIGDNNVFSITITSEAGLPYSSSYTLTVKREAKPTESVEIALNWEKGEDFLPHAPITIATDDDPIEIKIVSDTITGTIIWYVDTFEVQNSTEKTYSFDPKGCSAGTYVISVWAADNYGDAISIKVVKVENEGGSK